MNTKIHEDYDGGRDKMSEKHLVKIKLRWRKRGRKKCR
jgi:hypothetical protein